MDRGASWAIQSMGLQRVRHDWETNSFYFFLLIYLAAMGLNCGTQDLIFAMWDMVPWSGIEPRVLSWGAWRPPAKSLHCSLFWSVQVSCSIVSNSLWPHGLQHTRLPCPSATPRACSNSCHPTISSSVSPFASCLRSFPASGFFLMSQFFASGGQSIGASASASVLQGIFRTYFLKDWLVWSPCSPRDSQESSPTPQFKSITSSTLSFLYSLTLTSIHGYWKNHSFDWMDLCC